MVMIRRLKPKKCPADLLNRRKLEAPSPEMIAELERAVSEGATFQVAAELCGLQIFQLRRWLRRGIEGEHTACVELYVRLRKARADVMSYLARRIKKNQDWKAGRYLLQSLERQRYVDDIPGDKQLAPKDLQEAKDRIAEMNEEIESAIVRKETEPE